MAQNITITPSGERRGFNIDDFRATIQRRGIARNNMYKVLLTPPPVVARNAGIDQTFVSDLQIMATNVTLPGLQFATAEVRNQSVGPVEYKPYLPMFSRDLSLSFVVDQSGAVMDFFHTWMKSIINYSSVGRGYDKTTFGGAFPYEVSYKGEYETTMQIHVMDSQASISNGTAEVQDFIYKYTLYRAYPVSVMDTQVAYGITDQFLTLPVTFNYLDWSGESVAAKNGMQAQAQTPTNQAGPSQTQQNSFNPNIPNAQDQIGTSTGPTRG